MACALSARRLLDAWADAVSRAYALAKADRARELRGDRSVKAFDSSGVHPYSAEWGAIRMVEELLPGLSELRFVGPELTPSTMRRMAARDAERAFAESIRGGEVPFA